MLYKTTKKFIATVLLTLAMFFCGCSFAPKQVGPKPTHQWAYAPDSVVIHPLSRIRVTETEHATIIVHISLHDGDGFACRGVGILNVKATTPSGEFLGEEDINLQDAGINRQHFDQVTRTYRVKFDALSKDVKRAQVQASFKGIGDELLISKTSTLINHNQGD
ncbi:MAG TPA: hypothetical protein EYO01_00315 [Phycisphaerales bacterium]|nr:hypothetical protein [Phycisphaerales bacterium]HIB01187.1 hypothetical protein [Phycisphaerales bacterium]HIN83300.1 hypothetical protein [Phycisphaerales bacterium]HIO53486.1 hypothetical protein [Phycisphaerales bacterium]